MVLKAFLRILGSRCPECFERAGPGAVRYGMRLFCCAEHRDKHLERGDPSRHLVNRGEGGGFRCC